MIMEIRFRLTPFVLTVLFSLPGVFGQQGEPVFGEKQVVLETTAGTIVMEVFPNEAPKHVAAFLKRVQEGFYVGTAFHRAIKYGIIQGGDPYSRDPAQRELWGTGGLMELESEFNRISHTRGTVSAVLVPGNPDSAGSQFFICVSDQAQLDGQYTAFGRVVDGLDVAQRISAQETDDQQRLMQPVAVTSTFERNRPPPEVPPFAETPVEQLAKYRAVVHTTLGKIEIAFLPELAPQHVRQFLRFAELGIYNGTKFHRVVANFMVQGGSISSREIPVDEKHTKYLKRLQPEFSDRKHVSGIVSMARGPEVDSAMDSFFIVLTENEHLDGKYTIFGEVVRGLEVVDGIAQVPVRGEIPMMPVVIETITLNQE